jgi:glucose/arabinose dehydrogenase
MMMPKSFFPAFTILLFTVLAVAGCSATSTKQDAQGAAAPSKQEPQGAPTPTKQGAQGIVFRRTADDVQKAAANALVMTGFEIKKEEPLYVEGARPRTLGVLAAETVGVWLESLGPARTRVRIETAKSAVSIGQKNWDAAVLEEMEKTLGKRE